MSKGLVFNKLKQLYKSDHLFRLAIWVMFFWLLVALFSPFIANKEPIWVKYKGQHFFPALSNKKVYKIDGKTYLKQIINWDDISYSARINALIKYNANEMHLAESRLSPPLYKSKKGNRYWLGTRFLGQDLASGLIHGAAFSISVGIFSMLLATFIGLFMGILSGFYGNDILRINWLQLLLIVVLLPLFLFILWVASYYLPALVVFLISVLFLLLLYTTISYAKKFAETKIFFPLDSIISRSTEVMVALPKLIIILAIAASFQTSLLSLVLIIGLTGWTQIARLTRAEVLKLKANDYLDAQKILGLSNYRIIFAHVLPNALGPIIVAFAFGVGSVIVIESSLSFLGVGVPQSYTTWGSLLNEARAHMHAWWLLLFPGLSILSVVVALNIIGNRIQKVFIIQ